MRLGGTPLDPCIAVAIEIVSQFQKKYKVQKMNTIFLTDGCGHTNTNYTTINKYYEEGSEEPIRVYYRDLLLQFSLKSDKMKSP